MRSRLFMIALIGAIALCASGCSVSRKTLNEQRELRTAEVVRDTIVLREAVFESDTVREVTTVTVMLREPLDRTAAPDTVFRSVVTERDRVRDRVAATAVREKVEVRVDTVYIERDSVFKAVAAGPGAEVGADGAVSVGGSRFVAGLRRAVFLVVAVTVLILVLRFERKGSLI